MDDLEEILDNIKELKEIATNPKFKEIHDIIDAFPEDLESVDINFKKTMIILNDFLTKGIINEKIYNKFIHIINGQLEAYINEKNPKTLAYKCSGCGQYFLEKEDKYLKEKIHPFNSAKELSYVSYGICSDSCLNQKY